MEPDPEPPEPFVFITGGAGAVTLIWAKLEPFFEKSTVPPFLVFTVEVLL